MICGVGLCCSLGRSFAEAAKAYAAGDANFEKSDAVIGPDGMQLRLAPVFAFHEIHNFELRLCQLFTTALDDLAAQAGAWSEPVPLRLIVPSWLKGNVIEEGFLRWLSDEHATRFSNVILVSSENALVLSELASGLFAINHGECQTMVVGAIDSFMHAELIDALALEDRLLTKTQPHGVVPSEACALFKLTAEPVASLLTPAGIVEAVWTGRETESPARREGMIGRGLAEPFRSALEDMAPHRLMIDLNGERWRAEETGFALAGVKSLPDELTSDFETPPLHAGFSGCAMGGVMLALALAQGPEAGALAKLGDVEWTMISSSQYNGLRAVGLIGRDRTRDQRQEYAA